MTFTAQTTLALFGTLLLSACSKPVDPAYLAEIEAGMASLCRCVTLPESERMACRAAKKTVHPTKTPTGQAPGIYEESLDDASMALIDATRGKATSCETALNQ
jgi:hypothetical protein